MRVPTDRVTRDEDSEAHQAGEGAKAPPFQGGVGGGVTPIPIKTIATPGAEGVDYPGMNNEVNAKLR